MRRYPIVLLVTLTLILIAVALLPIHSAPPLKPAKPLAKPLAKPIDKKIQPEVQLYLSEVRINPTNLKHHIQLIGKAKESKLIKVPIYVYEDALERNPNSPLVRFLLGYTYMSAGGEQLTQRAIEEFNQAISIQQNFPEALMALADCYMLQGKRDLAVKVWKRAVEKEKRSLQAYLKLARFYRENGEYENAVFYYESLLKVAPSYVEVRLKLAELHFDNFNYSAASAEFMSCLKYRTQAVIYYRLSQIAILREDFTTAIDMCQKGLKLDPNDPNDLKAAYELVCALLDNSDESNAIKILKILLRAATSSASISLDSDSSSRADMISLILKVISVSKSPDSIDLRRILARLYLRSSDKADRELAISNLRKAELMASQDPDIHYMLGVIYEYEAGEPQKAFVEYEKAASLGSRNLKMLTKIADRYLMEKKVDNFIETASRIAEIGTNDPEIYLSLSQELYQKARSQKGSDSTQFYKLLDQAARYAQRSLELTPPEEAVRCYLLLAQIYEEHGKIKAIQMYDNAIKISPKDAEIYYRRAAFMLNFKVGLRDIPLYKEEEAIADLKTAIQYDPNLPEAHYWLGIAYERIGKGKLASDEFQIAKLLSERSER